MFRTQIWIWQYIRRDTTRPRAIEICDDRQEDWKMNQAAHIYERDLRNHRRKLRRQKEIRRTFILAGITLVLVLGFTLSYRALLSQANTDLEDITYKYYTSIQIEPGDTLWTLADRYADKEHYASQDQYIEEVMRMNHLAGEDICAGNYLILPYYSAQFLK